MTDALHWLCQLVFDLSFYIALGGLLGSAILATVALFMGPDRWTSPRDPHAPDCGVRTRGICDCGYLTAGTSEDEIARVKAFVRVRVEEIVAAAIAERDRQWLARIVR